MNTKLEVPMSTMAQIVNYLVTRPFSEVAVLMDLIKSPDIKEITDATTS